jgi:hypothetical protein
MTRPSVKNGRECVAPNSLYYQRLFRGIACHISIATHTSLASCAELHHEDSIFSIINETKQVVNQFMEILGLQRKLEDAVLDPYPMALQGFTQVVTPPVISHIIRNDHPLVHAPPSLLGDTPAQRVTND